MGYTPPAPEPVWGMQARTKEAGAQGAGGVGGTRVSLERTTCSSESRLGVLSSFSLAVLLVHCVSFAPPPLLLLLPKRAAEQAGVALDTTYALCTLVPSAHSPLSQKCIAPHIVQLGLGSRV